MRQAAADTLHVAGFTAQGDFAFSVHVDEFAPEQSTVGG